MAEVAVDPQPPLSPPSSPLRCKQVTLGAIALHLSSSSFSSMVASDSFFSSTSGNVPVLPPLADVIEHLLFLVRGVSKFDAMGLPFPLLRGVDNSYDPLAVHRLSISPMLRGFDVAIACSDRSRRTGALCIGLLAHMNAAHVKVSPPPVIGNDGEAAVAEQTPPSPYIGPQGLYLVPTRELANHTFFVMQHMGSFILPSKEKSVLRCVGSSQIEANLSCIKEHSPVVIIGTPMRIRDLLRYREGAMPFSNLRVIVFDALSALVDRDIGSGHLDEIVRAVFSPPSSSSSSTTTATPQATQQQQKQQQPSSTPQLIYGMDPSDRRTHFVERVQARKVQAEEEKRFSSSYSSLSAAAPPPPHPAPRCSIHVTATRATLTFCGGGGRKQFDIDVKDEEDKVFL